MITRTVTLTEVGENRYYEGAHLTAFVDFDPLTVVSYGVYVVSSEGPGWSSAYVGFQDLEILSVAAPPSGATAEDDDFDGDDIEEILYTPAPTFTGIDEFDYTIEGPFGGTDTATVTVNVAAAPDISVTFNGQIISTTTPLEIDASGESFDFDIHNALGGGALSIANINVGGPIMGATPTVATISPGSSATFTAYFYIPDSGPYSAWIEIVSNDPDESPFRFNINLSDSSSSPDDMIDLDGNDSTAPGVDFYTAFVIGGGETEVTDDDLIVNSPSGMFDMVTVTLKNPTNGSLEYLTVDASISSVLVFATDYQIQLFGPASTSEFHEVLRTIKYYNNAIMPDTTDRIIEFVANDGPATSNTATTRVALLAEDEIRLDLDGDNSSQAADPNFKTTFIFSFDDSTPRYATAMPPRTLRLILHAFRQLPIAGLADGNRNRSDIAMIIAKRKQPRRNDAADGSFASFRPTNETNSCSTRYSVTSQRITLPINTTRNAMETRRPHL